MKKQVLTTITFLFIITTSFAQQTICGGNVTGKKYWVSPTEKSTYNWEITEGNGTIVSGAGTNKVTVDWTQTTGKATLRVQETNNNGCIGEKTTITINFSGSSAELLGTNTQLCEPKEITDIAVKFTGSGPWDFTYSINDTPTTVTGITEATYPIPLNAKEYDTDYVVKLLSISDAICTGTSSGKVTVTIAPKIATSEIFFEK